MRFRGGYALTCVMSWEVVLRRLLEAWQLPSTKEGKYTAHGEVASLQSKNDFDLDAKQTTGYEAQVAGAITRGPCGCCAPRRHQVGLPWRWAEPVDFRRDVWPILQARCMTCHGPEKQKSSLRVDSRAALLKGGDSGPAIVAGEPGEELLARAGLGPEAATCGCRPKGQPLSAAQIATLRRWIAEGANWPADFAPARSEPQHWAFQPVSRPAVPEIKDGQFASHNPIDAFLAAKLAERGLTMSPPADPRTLIRRVTLDLTGLPPTPEEVEEFVDVPAPRRNGRAGDEGLSNARRPPARVAPLRRALGAALAGRDPLCRHDRIREQRDPAQRLALSRLCHCGPERRHSLPAVHPGAARGRHAGRRSGHGLPGHAALPFADRGRAGGGRHRPGALQRTGRGGAEHRQRDARNDRRLCPLPRSQVRSGQHAGLLPPGGDVRRLAIRGPTLAQRIAARPRKSLPPSSDWPRFAASSAPSRLARSRTHQHGRLLSSRSRAKWIRLTVEDTFTGQGYAPAIDEIEVWTPEANGDRRGTSAAQRPARSRDPAGRTCPLAAKDDFLNDGQVGRQSRWVARDRIDKAKAWVEIELPEPMLVHRVGWSCDHEEQANDLVAAKWRTLKQWQIEVAEEPGQWRTVVPADRDEGLAAAEAERRNALEKQFAAGRQRASGS